MLWEERAARKMGHVVAVQKLLLLGEERLADLLLCVPVRNLLLLWEELAHLLPRLLGVGSIWENRSHLESCSR